MKEEKAAAWASALDFELTFRRLHFHRMTKKKKSFGEKIGGCEKFAPDRAQMFYKHLAGFSKSFKKARVENEQAKIKAEKESKRAAMKGGVKKQTAGGEQKKDLFSAFKNAQAGETDDIVSEFQLRLASRRKNIEDADDGA